MGPYDDLGISNSCKFDLQSIFKRLNFFFKYLKSSRYRVESLSRKFSKINKLQNIYFWLFSFYVDC